MSTEGAHDDVIASADQLNKFGLKKSEVKFDPNKGVNWMLRQMHRFV